MIKIKSIFVLIVFQILFIVVSCSSGDKSAYYQNCVNTCLKQTCQNNVLLYKKGYEENTFDHLIEIWRKKKFNVDSLEHLIKWNCRDECKYGCMWRTTDAFIARKWRPAQFHGKWCFVRILGMQEPASVIFSALNLFVHYQGLKQFRSKVRQDSPLYAVWHTFSFICMNAWIFSMIFHTRDYPITELFDYVFAYSMVLASFWCFIIRILYGKSKKIIGFVTVICALFFLNHFIYLSQNYKFDYSYNMKVNIFTGSVGGVGWMIWSLSQIFKRKYVWKMLVFVTLALASTALEVYDFPPILWTFDAHSLWHLSSAPLTILFYKFVIEDCIQLRKEMNQNQPQDKEKLL